MAALAAACAPAPSAPPLPIASQARPSCEASVYWEGFDKPLADNRLHRPDEVLAAHPSLPIGSILRVTNVHNHLVARLPVRDRGPFAHHRCLDLTRPAARLLGITDLGRVTIEVLKGD